MQALMQNKFYCLIGHVNGKSLPVGTLPSDKVETLTNWRATSSAASWASSPRFCSSTRHTARSRPDGRVRARRRCANVGANMAVDAVAFTRHLSLCDHGYSLQWDAMMHH